jgi:hypothetical protein
MVPRCSWRVQAAAQTVTKRKDKYNTIPDRHHHALRNCDSRQSESYGVRNGLIL